MKHLLLMMALGLVSLLIAGCPPSGNQSVAGSQERTTQVAVNLTEFTIGMDPTSAPAGDVVFNVRNTGRAPHAFEVEGNGIEERTPVLQGGQTATLLVQNMKAGTYEIYCPVGNHEERGMKGTFTVTQ